MFTLVSKMVHAYNWNHACILKIWIGNSGRQPRNIYFLKFVMSRLIHENIYDKVSRHFYQLISQVTNMLLPG